MSVSVNVTGIKPAPAGDDSEDLEVSVPKKEWEDDCRVGLEINVKDIPKGVEKLRFYVDF